PAPPRPGGPDRGFLRGADASHDGDGPARPSAARGARAYPRATVHRAGFSRAAGASPPALHLARQAIDGFAKGSCAAQKTRRRAGAAWARPHSLHDLARRPDRPHPGSRRAVGFRDRASALSGGRLQPVLDRARERRLALRADRARYQQRHACAGVEAGKPVLIPGKRASISAATATAATASSAAPAVAAPTTIAAAVAARIAAPGLTAKRAAARIRSTGVAQTGGTAIVGNIGK